MTPPVQSRLVVDTAAIVANWRRFAVAGGPAATGAALKADGYGLGAVAVARALVAAGCRDLFVANWAEAAALGPQPDGVRVAVLHGIAPAEMPVALASPAIPVLVTPGQVASWRAAAPGRPCDVMIDTGMNRLGLSPRDAASGLLDGLAIDTLHSHLACADDPSNPLNARQLTVFREVAGRVPARRRAIANSAGVALGRDWHFDLTRPGLGLYGGGTAPEGGALGQPASIEALVLQVRDVPAGVTIGYGATFTTSRPGRLATVALGYADGFVRSLSNRGFAWHGGAACPLVGRVSMDLTVFDVTDAPAIAEGDWLAVPFDVAALSEASGRTPYELLTGLGPRYAREYR